MQVLIMTFWFLIQIMICFCIIYHTFHLTIWGFTGKSVCLVSTKFLEFVAVGGPYTEMKWSLQSVYSKSCTSCPVC